ncbi:FAD1 flavin adenine dinucleotide synthetase [Coemansia thaxteri]|uniref:FAD synthase n=1 Tax=Coemansia thaxteri TaxID=2663907 RepID=A0A9W8BA17_9FUNG|nr:FAD1 flavin adenine dinucleotide synthetase [Coemansia thaxteri]
MVSRTAAASAELDVVSLSLTTYGLADQPTDLGRKVTSALQVIEDAIERYGSLHLALSFNGGKDCTALMHLVRAALYRHSANQGCATDSSTELPLVSLYIQYKNSFPEMDSFVQNSVARYNLDLVKRSGPMRQGLQSFKSDYPGIRGIFVGTRRDDPYGNMLQFFSPTDPDWPQFMRINPILSWTFDDVWGFMRQAAVPYCCLYDQGYTSLGDVDSTKQNPALLKDGKYQPAWTLANGGLERSGRSTPGVTTDTSSISTLALESVSGLPVPNREARLSRDSSPGLNHGRSSSSSSLE